MRNLLDFASKNPGGLGICARWLLLGCQTIQLNKPLAFKVNVMDFDVFVSMLSLDEAPKGMEKGLGKAI